MVSVRFGEDAVDHDFDTRCEMHADVHRAQIFVGFNITFFCLCLGEFIELNLFDFHFSWHGQLTRARSRRSGAKIFADNRRL